MTKPLRYGTWNYDSALQTAVREVYRKLSVNKDRDQDCLCMGQLFWEGTFAVKVKNGASLQEAMVVLLRDQESNEKHRQALLTQWKQDVEDIERFFSNEQDDDDGSPKVRTESFLESLRQRLHDHVSYDTTERKSS